VDAKRSNRLNDDGSPTGSAGKRQHAGEAGQQIDGAAKWAPLRRYLQFELHFIERSTELSGLDGLDNRAAFVADDIHEITPFERQQESAAFWSTKIRMGENVFRRIHVFSVMLVHGGAPLVVGVTPYVARSQARLRRHELRTQRTSR
jgi:hypothetical protein